MASYWASIGDTEIHTSTDWTSRNIRGIEIGMAYYGWHQSGSRPWLVIVNRLSLCIAFGDGHRICVALLRSSHCLSGRRHAVVDSSAQEPQIPKKRSRPRVNASSAVRLLWRCRPPSNSSIAVYHLLHQLFRDLRLLVLEPRYQLLYSTPIHTQVGIF